MIGLATLGGVLIVVADAGACSCAPEDAETRVAGADVAFVGIVRARRDAHEQPPNPAFGVRSVYTFSVERAYKGSVGDTIEITMGGSDATCGYTPEVGERLGLVMRGGAPYTAGVCNFISPEQLERVSSPPMRPRGHGRVALLAPGALGRDADLVALDAHGRPLAYGFDGDRRGDASVCPGSQYVVQAGERLVVRRVSDLGVVARRRLPGYPQAVRCLDRHGHDVVIARRGVVRLRGSNSTVVTRGIPGQAVLGAERAVLTEGDVRDHALIVVDYGSGLRRTLVRFPEEAAFLALSSDGRRVAFVGLDVGTGQPRRLFLVDLHSGALRTAPLDADDYGAIVWLSERRLLLAPQPSFNGRLPSRARILDLRLSQVAELPTWRFYTAAVLGAAVWTVDNAGVLRRARPPAATATQVLVLPNAVSGIRKLVAVPGRPRLRASRRMPAAPPVRARAACKATR